jgi:hypothetical protein
MTGLEAELLTIITDCKTVARKQLVRHFVLRRNIYPDAVHKAIHRLMIGAVVLETEQGLALVRPDKVDSKERGPLKKPRQVKAVLGRPSKYDDDGNRRCSMCKKYLPIDNFTGHPTTQDRLQASCKGCKLESMRRSRAVSNYFIDRLYGRPRRSGTAT